MGVLPFRSDGDWKEPTTGAFFGVRLRDLDLVFMPEVGVFYDRSALNRRSRNWVIVPGFTVASRPTRRRVRR
jgi:hypothetical protein